MGPKKNEPPKKPEKKSNPSTSRIVTMDSIRNRQKEDSESQAYYAGGSEHSGQQILGRDQRGNDDSQALAEALIRASTSRGNNDLSGRASVVSLYNEACSGANESGSEYGDILTREPGMMNLLEESPLFSDESGRGQMMDPGMMIRDKPNRPFGGVGRRLGDAEDVETETGEEQIASPTSVNSSVTMASLPRVTLRMWQNGFNVDSGPLFSYSDPSCSELISNIVQGEVPPQILPPECGGDSGPVQVTVIDRRGEKYEESVRYFSGKGHVLGSPTPSVSACGPAGSTELSGGSQHVDGTREQSADVSGPIGGRVSPGESAKQASKSSAVSVNDFTVDGPTDFGGELGDTVILKIKLPSSAVIRLSVKGQDDISTVKSYIRRSISSLAGLEFDLLLPYPKRVLGNEEVAGSSEIRSSLLVLRTVTQATTKSPSQL